MMPWPCRLPCNTPQVRTAQALITSPLPSVSSPLRRATEEVAQLLVDCVTAGLVNDKHEVAALLGSTLLHAQGPREAAEVSRECWASLGGYSDDAGATCFRVDVKAQLLMYACNPAVRRSSTYGLPYITPPRFTPPCALSAELRRSVAL